MGSFSNNLENKLLDHVYNSTYTAPDTYIGLSTADITDDASGNAEPAGGSYAREQILPAGWNSAASRAITNNGVITFTKATDAWGTLTHWGIWDHVSNAAEANLLAHGALTNSQEVANGNTVSIADEAITISFNVSGASDYLANTFLNYVFKDGAFATPNATIHIALLTAKATDEGTGASIMSLEPGDQNNYVRQLFTDWDAASSGHLSNSSTIAFKNPSGSWGEIAHTCSVDASGAGNIFFHGRLDVAQTPELGSSVSFETGAYDITVT